MTSSWHVTRNNCGEHYISQTDDIIRTKTTPTIHWEEVSKAIDHESDIRTWHQWPETGVTCSHMYNHLLWKWLRCHHVSVELHTCWQQPAPLMTKAARWCSWADLTFASVLSPLCSIPESAVPKHSMNQICHSSILIRKLLVMINKSRNQWLNWDQLCSTFFLNLSWSLV